MMDKDQLIASVRSEIVALHKAIAVCEGFCGSGKVKQTLIQKKAEKLVYLASLVDPFFDSLDT
tara:strand:+ start:128 stop:316 length:189 start_codon:yes stop_codon:yes gene_type:complete